MNRLSPAALLATVLLVGSPHALGAGAQTVEVQINVCEPVARVVSALGLKSGAQRQAWYFDTRELTLLGHGLVFRMRESGTRSDLTSKLTAELTMKVARQDCGAIPPALVPAADGKCEIDLHGESMHGAVSLSRQLDAAATTALHEGRRLPDVLSATQIRYLRERVGLWPLPDAIERFGPVSLVAYRRKGERFVVDAWTMPAGERYLEISQKTTQMRALEVRAALLQRLARAGVAVCSDQSSQAANKLRLLAR